MWIRKNSKIENHGGDLCRIAGPALFVWCSEKFSHLVIQNLASKLLFVLSCPNFALQSTSRWVTRLIKRLIKTVTACHSLCGDLCDPFEKVTKTTKIARSNWWTWHDPRADELELTNDLETTDKAQVDKPRFETLNWEIESCPHQNQRTSKWSQATGTLCTGDHCP